MSANDGVLTCKGCGFAVSEPHDCPATWEENPAILRQKYAAALEDAADEDRRADRAERALAALRGAVEALAGEFERKAGRGTGSTDEDHRLRKCAKAIEALLRPGADLGRWVCEACGHHAFHHMDRCDCGGAPDCKCRRYRRPTPTEERCCGGTLNCSGGMVYVDPGIPGCATCGKRALAPGRDGRQP